MGIDRHTRYVRVYNRTRGCLLAGRVLIADTWAARRRGLLGRPRLESGEGLLLVPCRWVHSLGMAFPIDVVHLDRRGRIVRAYPLAPGRIGPPVARGYSVLELAAGTLARTGTIEGDLLEWEPLEPGNLERRE